MGKVVDLTKRRIVTFVFSALALTCFAARTAEADTINSNLSAGTELSGTMSGYFDLTALLAGNSLLSASLNFTFEEVEGYGYVGTSYSGYSGGGDSYSRFAVSYYSNPYESVTLSAGTQSGAAASTYSSSSSYVGYSYFSSTSCGRFSCFTTYLYTNYYNQFSGYSGPFGVSFDLDSAGLTDLADGILPFTLSTTGDARLTSATLTAALEPSAVPDASSTLTLLSMVLVGARVLRVERYRR